MESSPVELIFCFLATDITGSFAGVLFSVCFLAAGSERSINGANSKSRSDAIAKVI